MYRLRCPSCGWESILKVKDWEGRDSCINCAKEFIEKEWSIEDMHAWKPRSVGREWSPPKGWSSAANAPNQSRGNFQGRRGRNTGQGRRQQQTLRKDRGQPFQQGGGQRGSTFRNARGGLAYSGAGRGDGNTWDGHQENKANPPLNRGAFRGRPNLSARGSHRGQSNPGNQLGGQWMP